MKMILSFALLVASFPTFCQTAKVDSANGLTYVAIEPVKWQHNKPVCQRLYGYVSYDNMSNSAIIAGNAAHVSAPDTHPLMMDIQRYTIYNAEYDSLRTYGSGFLFTYLARHMDLKITD